MQPQTVAFCSELALTGVRAGRPWEQHARVRDGCLLSAASWSPARRRPSATGPTPGARVGQPQPAMPTCAPSSTPMTGSPPTTWPPYTPQLNPSSNTTAYHPRGPTGPGGVRCAPIRHRSGTLRRPIEATCPMRARADGAARSERVSHGQAVGKSQIKGTAAQATGAEESSQAQSASSILVTRSSAKAQARDMIPSLGLFAVRARIRGRAPYVPFVAIMVRRTPRPCPGHACS
ncbi:hypothetical protein ABIA33_005639 [Streptacidiphilus sp. MAP12-16]